MPKLLIVQSGGPTAVINASLAGAVLEAQRHRAIRVYGAVFGPAGLAGNRLADLSDIGADTWMRIAEAPGSALGSSRRQLSDDDWAAIVERLKVRQIQIVLYAGGNGSMHSACRLSRAAAQAGYGLQVIGIPKTIDNDLAGTYFTPGFPSAANFFAHAVRDAGEDNRSLPSPVMVVEVIGRNAGWIAGATVLARQRPDDAPHLIYLPERPLSEDRLAADVEAVYRRLGRAVVVACEGQRDAAGGFFGADLATTGEGKRQLPGNLGHMLAQTIARRLGVRARFEKPGLVGRSFAALALPADRTAARRCGEQAVRLAIGGAGGVMAALQADGSLTSVALEEVAGGERTVPPEWIDAAGNDVTGGFREYARGLVGEIPAHPRICFDAY